MMEFHHGILWGPSVGFTKSRREIEPKWVSEYIVKFYGKHRVKLRCPLGPIPEDLKKLHGTAKAIRVYRPWRPEVDALVIMPGALLVIEAKIFKYMDGLAKLPVYKSLVPHTPELREFADRPVEMQLLVPVEIPWVKATCKEQDVVMRVWAPDWVKKIWEERDKYWTPKYAVERERRKGILRDLGFE